MPFYQRGDVRIRYEETGSGFPLLVTPGGGLNSCVSNWPTAVFNAMEVFKSDFRCITMDQRNANSGESTGPVAVANSWDAFADDQLGLMDHLGIREFLFMGYCIGGCFAGKLMQRAPNRVVAAVFCQSVGHRPEDPTVMYRHGKENWAPDFMKRRPDVSTDTIEKYLHNLYAAQPDFLYSVSRNFIRSCQTPMLVLPDERTRASAADLDRYRLAGAKRRDHGIPVEGAGGAEATYDRPGAPFPPSAHPDARCRLIGGANVNRGDDCRSSVNCAGSTRSTGRRSADACASSAPVVSARGAAGRMVRPSAACPMAAGSTPRVTRGVMVGAGQRDGRTSRRRWSSDRPASSWRRRISIMIRATTGSAT